MTDATTLRELFDAVVAKINVLQDELGRAAAAEEQGQVRGDLRMVCMVGMPAIQARWRVLKGQLHGGAPNADVRASLEQLLLDLTAIVVVLQGRLRVIDESETPN